jgi:hypothetical protein
VNQLFDTAYEVPGGSSTAVQNSSIAGFNISLGETVTGYFSYDTSTAIPFIGGDPWLGYYFQLDGDFKQSLKFENSSSPISYGFNRLTTKLGADPYELYLLGDSGDYRSQWNIVFQHPGPHNIAEGYLPSSDQWSGFGGNSYFDFQQEGADQNSVVSLRANITSFRVLSAVPEPSIYLMIGTGLCILAFARRRSRTLPYTQKA